MKRRTNVCFVILLLLLSASIIASDLFPDADLTKPYEEWTYAEYYELSEQHMIDGFNCGFFLAVVDDCAYPDSYSRNAIRKSIALKEFMWEVAVSVELDTSYCLEAMLYAVLEGLNKEVAKNNQHYVYPGEEFILDESKVRGYSVSCWNGRDWNRLTAAEKVGFAHGLFLRKNTRASIAPEHITAVEYAKLIDDFYDHCDEGNFLIFIILGLSSQWGLQ